MLSRVEPTNRPHPRDFCLDGSQHHAVRELQLCLQLVHEQELLAVHVKLSQVGSQRASNQHLHAVLLDDMVVAGVAIADVGIDRYLRKLRGSSRHAHQVQGGPPALLLDVLYGLIGEIELQNRHSDTSIMIHYPHPHLTIVILRGVGGNPDI